MMKRTVCSLWFVVMAMGVGEVFGQESGVVGQVKQGGENSELSLLQRDSELELRDSESVFARYSFKDEKCKRPFFYNS